jgi:two-component sensor histidine kinase
VGDGLLILDVDGVVDFASPNALSAYRRLGLAADLVGARLSSLTASLASARGPVDEDLAVVASGRAARTTEVADRHAHVLLRSIPLVAAGERTGALVLVRDVTEVRRRERELVSKDATIREIHHRVKNNLQTVAARLRLQARRIASPEARSALEEAVQRVGSIAIVHEALSMAPDETVDFDEVADRVCAMVAELTPADARVVPHRTGSFGALAAETATPLAMALTELLQNAVEHGLGGRSRGEASLEIAARRSPGRLAVEVRDTGVGLPAGFDPGESGRLGLQIVRTLVVGELGGSLEFAAREGGGTAVALEIPLPTEQEARPR